jgi:hypothetical protein
MVKGKKVLIRSDNVSLVQYTNKQGETKSPPLCIQAWKMWHFSIHKIQLQAAHIAGKLNILPDQLSRVKTRQTEWSLHQTITHRIYKIS